MQFLDLGPHLDTQLGIQIRQRFIHEKNRRLADHGINYFEIRNRVRSHIAKCMLVETSIPVTSIALQLGYSETSAFSRGFKIQVGETPAEFRKRGKLTTLLY